jgi:hypothetical protein
MNLNDFAKEVTLDEGMKESLSIAQVKEVIRIVLKKLSVMPYKEVADTLKRIK